MKRVRRSRAHPDSRARALALALAVLAACDDLDIGRGEPDETAPRLQKILIASNRRFLLSDLLDDEPEVACSTTRPCPVDQPGAPTCLIPPGETEGICPRVYSVRNTPPPVDSESSQIRLVFHKILDPTALEGPFPVELLDEGGTPVEATATYQPSGSPDVSALPFFFPYGPALVFDTATSLTVSSTYTLTLAPDRLRDREGRVAREDVNGPLQTKYTFRTEPLYVLSTNFLDPLTPSTPLSLTTNAPIDESTLTSSTAVVVRRGPDPVAVRAFLHRGFTADTATCATGLVREQIDIIAVDAQGAPIPWPDGEYTLELPGVRDALGRSALFRDALATPFSATLVVETPLEQAEEAPGLILPEACLD